MRIFYILLFFMLTHDIALSFKPPTYNYTGYNAKYVNESINSESKSISNVYNNANDSSALFYIKYEDIYYKKEYTINDVTIFKIGTSSNIENTLSYCINSAVLNCGHSLILRRNSISTMAEGGIALCATNEGNFSVHNTNISTMAANSIGIHANENSYVDGKNNRIYVLGQDSPAISGKKGSSFSCTDCGFYSYNKGSPLFQISGNLNLEKIFGWTQSAQTIIADGKVNIDIYGSILNCSLSGIEEEPDACSILFKNSNGQNNKESDNSLLKLDNVVLMLNSEKAPVILVDNSSV